MKKFKVRTIITSVSTAALVSVALPGFAAHQGETANPGYLQDKDHHMVTDSYGHCWQTSAWKPELATEGCGAKMPKKEMAEPPPAPKPVAAPAPKPAPKVVTETVVLKAGTLFDFNRADIKPAGRQELDAVAQRVGSLSSVEGVRVVGHTDSTGPEVYNQKLSERRAIAVRDYLVGKGVPADKIEAVGMGETQPVATNATREGRAQNRRVEVELKGIQKVMQ